LIPLSLTRRSARPNIVAPFFFESEDTP
jgi:hypothetical protein